MPLEAKDRARLGDMALHARDAMTLLGSRTQEEMVADMADATRMARPPRQPHGSAALPGQSAKNSATSLAKPARAGGPDRRSASR
jgi:hypothetical protein